MSELDFARKCIRIAREAQRNGDSERAVRFLEKSLRLHRTQEAEALLQEYRTAPTAATADDPAMNEAPTEKTAQTAYAYTFTSQKKKEETVKTEPSSSTSTTSAAGPSSSAAGKVRKRRPFTKEQQEIAISILQRKDYYEVLGVGRQATVKEITSAFRKQARLVHPDKNSCQEADQAFKHLNRAYECLTDTEKRRIYDLSGQDENVPQFRFFHLPFIPSARHHSFHSDHPFMPLCIVFFLSPSSAATTKASTEVSSSSPSSSSSLRR